MIIITETKIEIQFDDRKGFEKPMPSPRPRFRKAGKFVQTYMPASYMKHKEYIQKQMPKLLIKDPVKLEIYFFIPMAKSWTKKKRTLLLNKPHHIKPDIDNLLKTVMDAANNHIWNDDGQVYEIVTKKIFSQEAKIIIKVIEFKS